MLDALKEKTELTFRQAASAAFRRPVNLKTETAMFFFTQRTTSFRASTCRVRFNLTMLTLSVLAVFSLGPATNAQTVTGTISGVVVDPNGAVVAGADVTLINDQTNDKREQPTNESGRFTFASVQPGVYSLRIEHAGFETLVRTKVVLSANEGLALGELALKTGQVTETVTVQGEGQLVENVKTFRKL